MESFFDMSTELIQKQIEIASEIENLSSSDSQRILKKNSEVQNVIGRLRDFSLICVATIVSGVISFLWIQSWNLFDLESMNIGIDFWFNGIDQLLDLYFVYYLLIGSVVSFFVFIIQKLYSLTTDPRNNNSHYEIPLLTMSVFSGLILFFFCFISLILAFVSFEYILFKTNKKWFIKKYLRKEKYPYKKQKKLSIEYEKNIPLIVNDSKSLESLLSLEKNRHTQKIYNDVEYHIKNSQEKNLIENQIQTNNQNTHLINND